MHTLYGIWCTTGCTCCRDENHWYSSGFSTQQEAEEKILEWLTGTWWPLASQYAERGCYAIFRFDIEELPDGRWIFGNYIADKNSFWENLPKDSYWHAKQIGDTHQLKSR